MQKLGLIKRVDKGWIATLKGLESGGNSTFINSFEFLFHSPTDAQYPSLFKNWKPIRI